MPVSPDYMAYGNEIDFDGQFMTDFHPDRSLPDCMVPDGGECCRGYYELVVDWRRLKTAAKGWISVRDQLPALNDTVVCTDGKHRWLDMRMAGFENLIWQGNLATHWHAIDALPTPPEQE